MKGARMQFMLCFILAVAVAAAAGGGTEKDGKIYIVHMDKSQNPAVFSNHEHSYQSIVSSVTRSRSVENETKGFTLLYVYDHVMHDFSAKLTQSELDALQTFPGHLASYRDTTGEEFYTNVIALGGFAAVEKGVFVSCSASNNGPDMFTVENDAPWMLTVGASTIDRSFVAKVKLGNGKRNFIRNIYVVLVD